MPPQTPGSNKKVVLFVLVELILLTGVFYAGVKFNASRQEPFVSSQSRKEKPAEPLRVDLPKSRLAYVSEGGAKVYDFRRGKEIDLGLTKVTKFLWSKSGQLAVLVQGEYGGDRGLLGAPKIFATTGGFNYLLYLADLEGKKPKLVLPEVFGGDVFWSEDSTGFYVSETYRAGKPLLLGERYMLPSDELRTFFVSLDGTKKPVGREVFDKERLRSSETISPDGKFYIKLGTWTDFAKIVEVESQKEYLLQPATRVFKAKWSPGGEKVAFIREAGDRESVLYATALSEVLAQNFSDKLRGGLPSAENVDFDWLDEQSVVVSQLNYISQPGYYQGNIGIYNVSSQEFRVVVPRITQYPGSSSTLISSPDKKFFSYQTSQNPQEEEIIISDLQGEEIKRLNGRGPSWEPLK